MLNAGHRRNPRQRLVEKAAGLSDIVASLRQLHVGGEYTLGAEAEIACLQLDEAAHQEPGAGQQHERQRDLGDDERAEHAVKPAAAAVASSLAQRVARLARRDDGGDHAERETSRQRDGKRERDRRQIERHLIEARYEDAIADQREQAAMAQRRDREARHTSGGGERQAFDEHLAHQSAPLRAKGGAHPELALARGAPRQLQIRDVDARHQQHEHHRADQRQERGTDLSDHLLLHVKEHHGPPGVALRLLMFQIGVDPSHLTERLIERDAVAHPRERVRAAAAVHRGKLCQAQTVGDEEVAFLADHGEGRGHHANHCLRSGVGGQRLAEDVLPGAETTTPEFVAQDDDFAGAEILVSGVGAAKQRLHAQRAKDVGRNHEPVNLIGAAVDDHRQARRPHHAQMLERVRALAPGDEIGRRDHVPAGAAAAGLPHGHDATGFAIRQRFDHHRAHDAEDGGGRADAEGERGQSRDSEARRPSQHAQSMAEVAGGVIDQRDEREERGLGVVAGRSHGEPPRLDGRFER
jgi:hypothetical protein